jgi:hypothetical protein
MARRPGPEFTGLDCEHVQMLMAPLDLDRDVDRVICQGGRRACILVNGNRSIATIKSFSMRVLVENNNTFSFILI